MIFYFANSEVHAWILCFYHSHKRKIVLQRIYILCAGIIEMIVPVGVVGFNFASSKCVKNFHSLIPFHTLWSHVSRRVLYYVFNCFYNFSSFFQYWRFPWYTIKVDESCEIIYTNCKFNRITNTNCCYLSCVRSLAWVSRFISVYPHSSFVVYRTYIEHELSSIYSVFVW